MSTSSWSAVLQANGENAENNTIAKDDEGEHNMLSTEILDDVKDFDSDDEVVSFFLFSVFFIF